MGPKRARKSIPTSLVVENPTSLDNDGSNRRSNRRSSDSSHTRPSFINPTDDSYDAVFEKKRIHDINEAAYVAPTNAKRIVMD
jgi:hypothetical protein